MESKPFDVALFTIAEADSSKISEFTLSLDGPTMCWYSWHDLQEVASFQDVHNRFSCLFHREIPKRELLRQFYAIAQEPQETIP